LIRNLIIKAILKQIANKEKDCKKQLLVFVGLIAEAEKCKNWEYKKEIELGMTYQEKLIERCDSLYSILS